MLIMNLVVSHDNCLFSKQIKMKIVNMSYYTNKKVHSEIDERLLLAFIADSDFSECGKCYSPSD